MDVSVVYRASFQQTTQTSSPFESHFVGCSVQERDRQEPFAGCVRLTGGLDL